LYFTVRKNKILYGVVSESKKIVYVITDVLYSLLSLILLILS